MADLARRTFFAAGILPFAARNAAFAAPASSLSAPVASLFGAEQWLNTRPLRPNDVRGKVLLVNIWTYSCIYCLRTLPYLRAWAAKYRDQGLVVIGVHSPEFEFEKDLGNVRTAVAFLNIGYPQAIDSDHRIWGAFNNEAWPAFYFVGSDGRIQDHLDGEGGYVRSERTIQALLSDANRARGTDDLVAAHGTGLEAPPGEAQDIRSSETYVGYAKAENFASAGGVHENRPSTYRIAPMLSRNHWGLEGLWTVGDEFASLDQAPGAISFRFHARDLHLILTPPLRGREVRFRVTLDGLTPAKDHGDDVDVQGWGVVRDPRLYQLVRQTRPVTDRTFRIEFSDPGVRAYDFTFG